MPDCSCSLGARLVTWIGCMVMVTAVASSVMAQPSGTASDALITRGVSLRRAGDDEGALALFTQAYERHRSPRARAQMALAEQALGRFVLAETHLEEALRAAGDPWIASNRATLEEALTSIRTRLGTLELRGGVPGAEVSIDGEPVGALPLRGGVRLPAGVFRVEVAAEGYYPFTRTVTIAAGGTTRESLAMRRETRTPVAEQGGTDEAGARSEPDATGPDAAATTSMLLVSTEPPEPGAPFVDHTRDAPRGAGDRRARRMRRLGFGLVGVSGAFGLTALSAYVVRERRARDYNDPSCIRDGLTRGESCGELRDEALRAQRVGVVSLVAGAASAISGTAMILTTKRDATSDETSRVACGPTLGATVGGRCEVAF